MEPSPDFRYGRSIAFVSNSDFTLYRFRRALIRSLLEKGLTVHGLAPRGEFASKLEDMGMEFHDWSVDRTGLNPLGEMASVISLVRLLKAIRPEICHSFTVKANIYGAIAARVSHVPAFISTYTGLGYLFSSDDGKAAMKQRFVRPLIRLAANLSDAVTFQNQEDLDEMLSRGLVTDEKAILIPGGSGVNIDEYSPGIVPEETRQQLRRELGIPDQCVVVLFVGRMLWHKGVGEYVECARQLRDEGLGVRFLLVGGLDDGNPAAVPARQLQQWQAQQSISYLGYRGDIIELLSLADLMVFPSYYREGVPRALIEAAAMGLTIVTTDSIGCKEVVDHQVNGLLVRPRNVADLVAAVRRLVTQPELRESYGQASRRKALHEFRDEDVVNHTLSVYETVVTKKKGRGGSTAESRS